MSLIVTVYVNDGIIMASDSRTTLTNTIKEKSSTIINQFPLSDSTFKTFLCCNNCGISTCGAASYNNKPITGFIEKFIQDFIKKDTPVADMPQMLLDYFDKIDSKSVTIFHICGYEKNDTIFTQHAYRVITGPNKGIFELTQNESCGALWNGEDVYLTKLLKGQIINPQFIPVDNLSIRMQNSSEITIPKALVINTEGIELYSDAKIAFEYMSLQDAIDFAKYAIETTVKTMQFQAVAKTVGGPIDILSITPSGAKWIKHKQITG